MITISVTNCTSQILQFRDLVCSGHTKAKADASDVEPLGTISLAMTMDHSAWISSGSFNLFGDAGSTFSISFSAQDEGNVTVALQSGTSTGNVAGVSQTSYPLTGPVHTKMNVYTGQLAGTTAQPAHVVPLATWCYDQQGNCQDFVNSMFWPNVRQAAIVQNAFDQGAAVPYRAADFTGGQLDGVTEALREALLDNVKEDDSQIMRFLAGYLAPDNEQPPLTMWVPTFSYVKQNSSGLPVYQLTGYKSYVPATDTNDQFAVGPDWDVFVGLLVGGAHFVAISAYADFDNQNVSRDGARSLLDSFRNSGLSQERDPANSHYCSSWRVNTTGYYYLDIDVDWAEPGSQLLLALLFGSTVNTWHFSSPTANQYNTFMQLEGWQTSKYGSPRHKADFDAHKESLWNFSTFGALPYSEKRALTVFLAPPQWQPSIYQTTLMMPYVGAYASGGKPQSWLNTSAVQVPAGTAALPKQYNS